MNNDEANIQEKKEMRGWPGIQDAFSWEASAKSRGRAEKVGLWHYFYHTHALGRQSLSLGTTKELP